MDRADLPKLTRRSALTASALAALGGITLAPTAAQDATPASGEAEEHYPVFLFVQLAESGTWSPSDESPEVFLLSLTGVSSQTIFFSDRPDRIVGTMETSGFLESLGFTPFNPPNAAAVVRTPEGERDVLVVELFDPVYTEDFANPGAATLIYKARVLDAYRDGGLESWYAEQDDPILPESFEDVSLLIDDCPDLQWCYRLGATIFDPPVGIGPLPGGAVGTCWQYPLGGCQPCGNRHSLQYYWDLCNQAYADCQGNCDAR